MKRLVVILLTILMLFSLFQGTLRENVVKADCGWQEMNVKFENLQELPGDMFVLAIDPKNPNIIFIGAWNGVFKSIDGGQNFKPINKGLPWGAEVFYLATDPKKTNVIYVGAMDGVFKSIDGGENWNKLNTGATAIYPVVIDPKNTDVIYVGAAGKNSGVLKSTNAGQNWSLMNKGLGGGGGTSVFSLAIDSKNTNTLYAKVIYTKGGSGIYKSTDGGENWNEITAGLTDPGISCIAIDPANTSTVYIGTLNRNVFKSTDGGEHWDKKSFAKISISSIVIDPTNTNTIYAWGDSGVCKSTDGGENWNELNTGLDNIKVEYLAIDPTNTNTIYAIPKTGYKIFKYRCDLFVITVSAFLHGQVSPSDTITATYGENKTFSITPDKGYQIKEVKIDGSSVGAVSTYTFTNITSNHFVEVEFEKKATRIILQVDNPIMKINGVPAEIDPGRGTKPVIENNRTLLPIRVIIESLGGTVGWDVNEKKVTVILGNTTIELWIGNSSAVVDGNVMNIDPDNPKVVPIIINSRTMLPIRFIAENLGCQVDWDNNTQTVTIAYSRGG